VETTLARAFFYFEMPKTTDITGASETSFLKLYEGVKLAGLLI
jgi:hypothetical protein